jgi:5'-nucleotidase
MARTHEKILGVDLDNVVADYTHGLRTVVAAVEGRPATVEEYPDPTDWSYSHWGLDDDAFAKMHTTAVRDHQLFSAMPVRPGAAEVLQQLSRDGVRIRIVTARLFLPSLHAESASQTVAWLDAHKIPYWDLCLLTRKTDVGCHAYVDDSPSQIAALREDGHDVVAMDWPYNRHLAGPRAKTWAEVDVHVRRMLDVPARAVDDAA